MKKNVIWNITFSIKQNLKKRDKLWIEIAKEMKMNKKFFIIKINDFNKIYL